MKKTSKKMKQVELFAYLYDFISLFFDSLTDKEKIRRIVLFGSIASGRFDEKSDIDLFFDVKNDMKSVEMDIKKSLALFERKKEEPWGLRRIDLPVKCIVDDLDKEKWKALKQDMISNGILLYGKFEELPEGIKHFTSFDYSLSNLKMKNKVKIIRKLFGYKIRKGRKIYTIEGLLHKYGGDKITQNYIIVPIENASPFEEFFRKNKIKADIKEIWTRA